jgi:hypothetical protein
MTRQNLEQQLGKIKEEFLVNPQGKSTVREITLLMDRVLDSAYMKARKALQSNGNESALLATGGVANCILTPILISSFFLKTPFKLRTRNS